MLGCSDVAARARLMCLAVSVFLEQTAVFVRFIGANRSSCPEFWSNGLANWPTAPRNLRPPQLPSRPRLRQQTLHRHPEDVCELGKRLQRRVAALPLNVSNDEHAHT
jgi:hypothetical protein